MGARIRGLQPPDDYGVATPELAACQAPAPVAVAVRHSVSKRGVAVQKPKQIKPQYGVIAVCKDERHQKQVYESLRKRFPGLKLKVVCV